MAAFEYEALDVGGRLRRGVVTADSAKLARRELRGNQLSPIKLAAVQKDSSERGVSGATKSKVKVGISDLASATRQIATMAGTGAPLDESLNAVAQQTEHVGLRQVLLTVRSDVREGRRFADALARHPGVFSPLYVALAAAGELSGSLAIVLDRLANHLEKAARVRSKVIAALAYPCALAFVAAGAVALLVAFVVPKVVEQFTGMGQELPLLTRGLMAVSSAVANYGAVAVAACFGLAYVTSRRLRDATVRRRVDRNLLRLPLIGRLIRKLEASRLARTLATLISGGVPVLDALSSAHAVVGNRAIADAVGAMIVAVREGESVAAALRRSGLFPPVVAHMAATGESTGRLDAMLEKAAEQLEREFEDSTGMVISLLEPGIIVVMGGLVALIVLAILLPIFQLNTLALS